MAMGWLKGLVAPAAQFGGQQAQPQGAPMAGQQPGGPPIGGAPPVGGAAPPFGSPYGVQQGQGMSQPAQVAPQAPGFDPSAMQWSTGTRSQGSAASAQGSQGSQGSLEARCAELQRDVESLALFARTLLTMLEEAKVVTREQFEATKHRLDMLDGKLDDR